MTRSLLVLLLLVSCAVGFGGCGRAENSLLLLDELPNVGTITLVGNEQFTDKELKGLMALSEPQWWNPFGDHKFRASQLDSDVLAILTHYMRHGYLRTRVVDLQKELVDDAMNVRITLEEGPRVTVETVVVMGASALNPNDVRGDLATQSSRPLDPFRLDEDRRLILSELADLGYWQAKVQTNVQFFGDRAQVFYRLREGDPVIVDTLTITGLENVSESLARREVAVKEKEILRLKDLTQTQVWLLQSDLFVDARWDTVAMDTTADHVSVRLDLRERRMARLEGGVGVSSQELVRLGVGWYTRNLLGTGTRYGISTSVNLDLTGRLGSSVDEWRLDSFLNIPHSLGSRWELQPSVSFLLDRGLITVRDGLGDVVARGLFEQQIAGVALSTRRVLGNPRNQVVFALENRWVFNTADSVSIENDPQLFRENYITRSLSARLDLDRRNDFFEPTRGAYYNVFLESAGGALGGNNSFFKASAGTAEFGVPPHVGPIIALRAAAGIIHASAGGVIGDRPITEPVEAVPVEDRYFLGGANTIRGYFQDELNGSLGTSSALPGGLVQLLGGVETRMKVWGRLGVVGFLDMGNVWQDGSTLTLEGFVPHGDPAKVSPYDVRYSYGIGARFSTPLGPVRVDYARKWNHLPGEDPDRVHFAIGHAF